MSTPEKQCRAALNIAGEHYRCDLSANHYGAAHANTEADAVWRGDGKDDTK